MTNFIGEHKAKIDAKGRVNFPSAYIKQMFNNEEKKFVVKKDIFSNCLIFHTIEEWEKQVAILNKNINPYNRKHAKFFREFFKGVAELKLDSNNRILIPQRLIEDIGITKEVIFIGEMQKIQLWSLEEYEKDAMSADEFANLSEEVIGGEQINL